MIFLCCIGWYGPSRGARRDASFIGEARERPITWASRLPLAHAIHKLEEYRIEFARSYPLSAVSHTLLSVHDVDDLDAITLGAVGIHIVEDAVERLREEREPEAG